MFERFPGEDAFEMYWTILHHFEGRGNYEQSLLQSLRRNPSPFALLMLRRIVNAGRRECAGESIRNVLQAIAHSHDASQELRAEAEEVLADME